MGVRSKHNKRKILQVDFDAKGRDKGKVFVGDKPGDKTDENQRKLFLSRSSTKNAESGRVVLCARQDDGEDMFVRADQVASRALRVGKKCCTWESFALADVAAPTKAAVALQLYMDVRQLLRPRPWVPPV